VSIFPKESYRLQISWVENEGLPLRWEKWSRQNRAALQRVLKAIDDRGPMSADDFSEGTRIDDYRSRRLEGLALYVLWRQLELLVHHREDGLKFYDRAERLFGKRPEAWSKDETLRSMALETLSWLGLSGHYGISYLRTQEDSRGRSKITKREIRESLVKHGRLAEVRVEGESEPAVIRTDQKSLLEAVAAGEIPQEWKPLQETPEAVFLGPLDVVFTRERAKSLFNFEYLWEVYKPPSRRRWGYYVLPVLLADRLIGRIEPVRDKRTGALRVTRGWWEKGTNLLEVIDPLALGLRRFADYLEAEDVILDNVGPASFRGALTRELRRLRN
jgi:uncharacterized protein